MKKLFFIGLVAVLMTALTIPVHALENIPSNDLQEMSFDRQQAEMMKKFNALFIDKGLAKTMKTDEQGILYFDDKDLVNLNEDELNFLSSMIDTSFLYPYNETPHQNIPQSRITVKNWRIYFTYKEVRKYFSGAAAIGPHAVYAAMVALGSVVGGPLGAGITGLLGAVGGSVLYSNVIKALNKHRGMYIGFTGCGLV